MALIKFVLVILVSSLIRCEDELQDFEFDDPEEVMIAQESRHQQTVVKPPIRIYKPTGITNSHRPQYNLDSLEDDRDIKEQKDESDFMMCGPSTSRLDCKTQYKLKLKNREAMIKNAVLRALERKDHVGKFAQILPIIRAMSGSQRQTLASLVASQVNTPPGRAPLNLAQVRSMYGNDENTTSDLMLPILLDTANLIRRAVRSGKQPRDVIQPLTLPQAQLLRRSFTELSDDIYLDDEPFDTGNTVNTITTTTKAPRTRRPIRTSYRRTQEKTKTQVQKTQTQEKTQDNVTNTTQNVSVVDKNVTNDIDTKNIDVDVDGDDSTSQNKSSTTSSSPEKELTQQTVSQVKAREKVAVRPSTDSSLDLAADSTNTSLSQDLPVAEKLRAFNRFVDRNGNIRRGTYPPKPSAQNRRTTSEPTHSPVVVRRRPTPARKLPTPVADQGNCELFTNTLCLHSEDYPTDAIVQSIRRNKAAAGALLADFQDPGEGALDGITAAQEAKYTAEHYLTSNRRGDTATRDFASAGEAGFMCPSTVKYARPQRARATSGQWKYIVNTGEHTQTLRLEKCLKPKESCTYLTDNFKSKCVQVYNYHRLLTWDQQNGLHMDIFKVPTCCSCHIEGYSVSFPPLGHRVHETSSNENFPGEDLPPEHGNGAFEQVQSSVNRPSKTNVFNHKKPIVDSFPPFSDTHNLLTGSPFVHSKVNDNDELSHLSALDSYGNPYTVPDSFNQASSTRYVKRPGLRERPIASNSFDTATISATLSSYLEPPTPSAPAFSFAKDSNMKLGNKFERSRQRTRPIRKKIGGPIDLHSSATTAIENVELEHFRDDSEDEEKISIVSPERKPSRISSMPVVSSERPSTAKPKEHIPPKATVYANGKRINYNYHPILEFFEEDDKDENKSIDREDSVSAFVATENEWKPINHPHNSRQATLLERKKHK